ncbi:MAG: YegS/Rv2252/BmrU family lipid kinase [Ruminococcaceae bacterium]|nr:YegS/Rv2252/BmrU family lipid kinase [Oscillospiraceae bacterium]
MKTVFIVNPHAGRQNKAQMLIDEINELCSIETEIYLTKAVGDATRYIREYINNHGPARFIACGGDGTFNEVLNGIKDCDAAEAGVIPIGTGNDFRRNFSGLFDDITKQINAGTVKCDAIRYTIQTDGEAVTGYCANMFNIGFDCNVADMTARIKKSPFISGSVAYFVSILINLIGKKGANLDIEIDGEAMYSGKLLLTSIANGCYCGGGIKSNPLASVCDGTININIIKNVPRLKFLRLLPAYMKGTFMSISNIDKIILSTNCRKIAVTPLNGKMRLCIDGEIVNAGRTEFEICPGAFNFVVPSEVKQPMTV